MDFLKTLLAYMALMTALSVQEGPLPHEVATPTPLPPSVTATLVPHQTEAPTATPSPSPAPAPLITPNTRYETVDFDMRGSGVKKLQNKLIELGYMPEGSADGAFGYQTYNAVKAFQQANGLEVDGVAGPMTLTQLYENPDVIPYIAPTVPPTATPTLPSSYDFEGTVPPGSSETPAPEAEDDVEAIATPAPAQSAASLGLTEISDPYIILGSSGSTLTMTLQQEELIVQMRPHLWQNTAGDAVMSLQELAQSISGWSLAGSSADGHYILGAQGYVVDIQCTSTSVMVTVDGIPVAVTAADVQLKDNTLFVTDDFLEIVLGATTVYDEAERSLVIFLTDKSLAEAND
ncbi:MAG: peptidoglycan-binding protein [Clostridia bacterium]|nr:peptidoglycan-binding protein [Clostridia bacterium]